jgi:hypothetical protein
VSRYHRVPVLLTVIPPVEIGTAEVYEETDGLRVNMTITHPKAVSLIDKIPYGVSFRTGSAPGVDPQQVLLTFDPEIWSR